MRKIFTIIFLFLNLNIVVAQHNISGKITDEKSKPVIGASVYLENTLDGGSTDSLGIFKFQTEEKGEQVLVVSAVGYSAAGKPLNIGGDISDIKLTIKNTAKTLEEVTITAGSFEASNDKDKTVLKPLDIVTTAGAQADVVRAIETLPGTQKQGTQNGLFVRGGDASEAAFIVDGLVIQNAFFSGPPGVATRSRFNAFQSKGVSFSSGGYSARYGQALSSVLEVSSLDLPDKTTINLGANMAGVYGSGSKLWKNSGGDFTGFYNNLQPFYGAIKTNFDFYDVPEGYGASARYAWKPNKNGIVKTIVNFNHFSSGIEIPNPGVPGDVVRFGLQNDYYTGQLSWKQTFKDKLIFYAAGSHNYSKDKTSFSGILGEQKEVRSQGRVEGKYMFASRFNLLLGSDLQHFEIENRFDTFKRSFDENIISGYAEAEWVPVYWLAFKPGVRFEHSALLNKSSIAPRLALAIKTGDYAQVSLAGGMFYQLPDYVYLYTVKPFNYDYDFQKAIHYIANYQWQRSDRTLRVEAYYKDYKSLVREFWYDTLSFDPNNFRSLENSIATGNVVINNNGDGYATGAELFWRDKKTVKNADYWISYSYIDTRRLYKNFIDRATPTFIATHNLNVVGKYWIEKLETQVNCTYSYASGRPYFNPTNDAFLSDRTPDYHNLSFTVNYLRSFGRWFSVFYAGVDNLTNYKNVFGYRYSADGKTRYPQVPALYRSFFIGVHLSLSKFDKDEL